MLPVRLFLSALHHLCHKVAHSSRCLVLLLPGGVGVGAEGEPGVVVTQYRGYGFHIHAVLQGGGGEGMPLRYNKDKRKNPVFSRVSAFVVAYSIPFPTLIASEKSVE